jgi:hypothetical protein
MRNGRTPGIQEIVRLLDVGLGGRREDALDTSEEGTRRISLVEEV